MATVVLEDSRINCQKPTVMFGVQDVCENAKEECIRLEISYYSLLASGLNISVETMIGEIIRIGPMTISLSSLNTFLHIYGSFPVLILSLFST